MPKAISFCIGLRHSLAVLAEGFLPPMTTKRAALYVRVSTDDQTVDNQRQALLRVAERRRWLVTKEYADEGISQGPRQAP
jgi:hypothetical protein